MNLFETFVHFDVFCILLSLFRVWGEITPKNTTGTKIFLTGPPVYSGTVFHNETKQHFFQYEKGPCGKLMWIVEESPRSSSGICQCIQTPLGIRSLSYWQPTNRCYFLYKQGPCGKDEWLNYNATLQKVQCQKNPCSTSQLEIQTDEITLEGLIDLETKFTLIDNDDSNNDTTCLKNEIILRSWYFQRGRNEISRFVFHNESQKFYPHGERGPCPILMVLRWSPYGYGECFCTSIGSPGTAERQILYWKNTNRCYFSFHQGPCAKGKWLVSNENREAECKKTSCPISPLVNNETVEFLKSDIKFFVSVNGSCYETNTVAFCGKSQKLFVSQQDGIPNCFHLQEDGNPVLHSSVEAVAVSNAQSCAPGYIWDESNNCVKSANIE